MPVIINDPKPPPKVGGHYYRVTAWDKDKPGLPTSPDASKAVWRKHNLLDDVVETTEPIVGVVALDIAKEGIPANGIGNWTVADFKGVQRDEEAYKPFNLNAHKVKNHCVGVLTYDEVQALKYYCEKFKADKSLLKMQAAADLRAIAESMPWGEAFSKGCPVVGLDGALLTREKLAEKWAAIIPAPVPKTLERVVEAAYDVVVEDRIVPLGTVEEEEAADLFAEARAAKVPGWSPTNAYVGTVIENTVANNAVYRIGYDDGTTAYTKVGQTFTAPGNITVASIVLRMGQTGSVAGIGNIVLTVRDGNAGGAGTVLATWEIAAAEVIPNGYNCFGGTPFTRSNGERYHLELSITGTADSTNNVYVGYSNGGTIYAGGGELLYTVAGGWAAEGTLDIGFGIYNNADGGKFLVRADDTIASFATIKGAAVHTSDTYTVTMGATLTRATGVTILHGRQGDSIAASFSSVGYRAETVTYRYGYEVVNAGVTVTWTGNTTQGNSGWGQNPATADASSKSCRITLNGTAGSLIKVTNTSDSDNTNYKWTVASAYGGFQGQYFSMHWMCGGASLSYAWYLSPLDSRTTLTEIVISHANLNCYQNGNRPQLGFTASPNLPVRFEGCTWTVGAGAREPMIFVTTPEAGFSFRWCGLVAGSGTGTIYPVAAGNNLYWFNDGLYVTDTRFSEAAPATFAVADAGTGGELDFTVSNISAISAGDFLVVYNSGGGEIGRISRAAYEAALYNKPANTFRLGGFVDATAYSGMYAKFTRDSILFSAASNTASGTPTAPAGGGGVPVFGGQIVRRA